jgi:NADH dehydrogenase FAD-containing subunit
MVKDRPARIVIVGGGFGGVYTAIALEKLLGHGPALVGESARTATVRSRSSVNVLAVDRDAFQALFTNLPPLRGFFEQLIAMRRQ